MITDERLKRVLNFCEFQLADQEVDELIKELLDRRAKDAKGEYAIADNVSAIDILDGNAPPINWRNENHSELLRKLCQHLEHFESIKALLGIHEGRKVDEAKYWRSDAGVLAKTVNGLIEEHSTGFFIGTKLDMPKLWDEITAAEYEAAKPPVAGAKEIEPLCQGASVGFYMHEYRAKINELIDAINEMRKR